MHSVIVPSPLQLALLALPQELAAMSSSWQETEKTTAAKAASQSDGAVVHVAILAQICDANCEPAPLVLPLPLVAVLLLLHATATRAAATRAARRIARAYHRLSLQR